MILKSISILNYKNIVTANLDLSPNINCLIGQNGMGKTNFLDAVYFLSFCRSANRTPDSLAVTHGQEFFVIDGEYLNENGDIERIYCGMKKGQKKHFKRNKKEYKKLSEHIGLIPLIFVSPSDTLVIEGGSEERRRLMDVVIAQYDRAYINSLNNYAKALQQRNALLKLDSPDLTLMEIWEQQMASEGERIFQARQDFVSQLVPVFQKVYGQICGEKETVGVKYVSHCQRGNLLDVIQRDRAKDLIMGFSLHGVHRDELDFTIDDYPMKREGSQGQNKTFAIALKLAQFDFLRRTNSRTTPILLLDDIFDKLDSERVEQIVKMVSGDDYGQIFITDTNREHLDKILSHSSSDYRIFYVKNGEFSDSK